MTADRMEEAIAAFKSAWTAKGMEIGRGISEPGTKTRAGLEAAAPFLASQGEWVNDASEAESLPEGSLVLAVWMHDATPRPYELVKYRLLRAVGAAHGKSGAQFEYPARVIYRPDREVSHG